MAEATITVEHEVGLHARPAAKFAKMAATFESDITVSNVTIGGDPVNAKSVLHIISKAKVAGGHDVRIEASGPDEDAAIAALVELVETNFGE